MPFWFAVIIVGALHFLSFFERSNLVLLQWFFSALRDTLNGVACIALVGVVVVMSSIYSMCMKCYVRLTTAITAITTEAAFHGNLKKYLQVLITHHCNHREL